MQDLPPIRLTQYGVFTLAQAVTSGLSRHQVQRLRQGGLLVTLRRGVYVDAVEFRALYADDRLRAVAVAASLARVGAVVSHHSAALIHDLPRISAHPTRPSVTVESSPSLHGTRDPSLRIRAARLPASHVESRAAWAVTTAARTICDLARDGFALDAVVAAAAALRRRVTSTRAAADDCDSWVGSSQLRALHRADGRSESPYETVARWHLLPL